MVKGEVNRFFEGSVFGLSCLRFFVRRIELWIEKEKLYVELFCIVEVVIACGLIFILFFSDFFKVICVVVCY